LILIKGTRKLALATLATIQELGFLAPVTVFVWLELQKIDADVKKIS
jgi:hypothetical protein